MTGVAMLEDDHQGNSATCGDHNKDGVTRPTDATRALTLKTRFRGPTRGPNVGETIGSTMRIRVGRKTRSACK
jgi:hypothetical protein